MTDGGGYVPIAELRRQVAPLTLCLRCLSRAEMGRMVCRDCVRELDAIRWKQTKPKRPKSPEQIARDEAAAFAHYGDFDKDWRGLVPEGAGLDGNVVG